MSVLVVLFGVLIVATGAAALIQPTFLRRWLERWAEGRRLYAAIALRLAAGGLFLAAAPDCRLPGVINVVGVILLASGVIGLLLGVERLRTFARWWLARSDAVVRLWAVVTVGFGALVVYAAS